MTECLRLFHFGHVFPVLIAHQNHLLFLIWGSQGLFWPPAQSPWASVSTLWPRSSSFHVGCHGHWFKVFLIVVSEFSRICSTRYNQGSWQSFVDPIQITSITNYLYRPVFGNWKYGNSWISCSNSLSGGNPLGSRNTSLYACNNSSNCCLCFLVHPSRDSLRLASYWIFFTLTFS